MSTPDRIYGGYGDNPPWGKGPSQKRVHFEGNVYLERDFPLLSYIARADIVGKSCPREAVDQDDHDSERLALQLMLAGLSLAVACVFAMAVLLRRHRMQKYECKIAQLDRGE